MPAIKQNDPRPPYVQIADELRRAIASGELKPGDRLAPGRAMARQYGVAHMTVSNALNLLREEGLLQSWQGRGVFVAEAPTPTPTAGGEDLPAKVAALAANLDEISNRVAALEARSR
jgi:GntR family transcriptional regulator